jgi:hypothetical protein
MAADNTYWAGREPKAMLREAFKRIDAWFRHIETSGKLNLWRTALSEYYAGAITGGSVGEAGEQGELLTMKMNHLHNIGEHVVTAVAGQPPAFNPQAQNNDQEATSQTDVSRVVLEACVSQKGLGKAFVQTCRRAWVLDEGYASTEWDRGLGEDYAADPATGGVVKTGDVRVRTFSPIDVVRDYLREEGDDHEWFITRRFENRYNVLARAMASAPDEETKARWQANILALPSKLEDPDRPRLSDYTVKEGEDASEEIAVYELRHAKTDALAKGRRTVFVSPEVWLEDGALAYRGLFVFRMVPEERIGEEGGYTPSYDLMAPQHAVNAAFSSQLSGLAALGHSVVALPANSTATVEELKAFSLLRLEGGAGEAKALSLLPEGALKPHAEFADRLVSGMETVSGVNSVRRGNAAGMGASSSGAKLALVDAKFYESIVGLQRSFKDFASAVATSIVQLYQDNATIEQTVSVAGKDKRVAAKTFTGEQLKKVLRVEIEMGDPLSRTSAGRLELATMLLQATGADGKPILKTPEQILQVVRTGRLDPLTQGQGAELDNIKAENELLGDGKPAAPFIYDNHPLHIQEHYAVMASPESRAEGSPVLGVVLQHIADHLKLWQGAPIDGLAARNIPPAPSMTMMAPPVPGASSGTPPPRPGETSSTGVPGPDEAGQQPNLPSLPTNPATGEQAPGPVMV